MNDNNGGVGVNRPLGNAPAARRTIVSFAAPHVAVPHQARAE